MATNRLISVEIIRFLAAISVVLHHIPTIDIGVFGVDAFFIISGFVMMISTEENFKNFFFKRLVRIIPLYWIATIIIFFLAIIKPELFYSTTSNFNHLLNSLFFIPFNKNGVGHSPLLEIGWTLNLEILFYFLFYLSLIISSKYRDIIATFFISITIILFGNFNFFIANVYSDILLLEFVFGIILYNIIYKKHNFKNFFIILLLIIVLAIKNTFPHRLFYFGIPVAVICYLFIKYLEKLRYSKLFISLGGFSYSLYITHVFIIRIFDRLLPWFESQLNIYRLLATLLSIFGALIIGYLTYKYIDMPIYKKLKSFL